MPAELTPAQLDDLRDSAAGRAGARATIERAGLNDYADLIIALACNDLPFPRPADTPGRQANLARARKILTPRLRHPC
jgi:hypothetical protein